MWAQNRMGTCGHVHLWMGWLRVFSTGYNFHGLECAAQCIVVQLSTAQLPISCRLPILEATVRSLNLPHAVPCMQCQWPVVDEVLLVVKPKVKCD